ncbi:MAG: hypothetical protein CMF58_02385 [Lentimicrobiaceae bacterium]|jgi:hypothetical protein|nr:hypothetical protein [Lentimicrobiaceae bacterium]|tara:strand:+ start:2072 stop:3226 length:1155 start_codon:yes stop_codon:yes gene_type:complete
MYLRSEFDYQIGSMKKQIILSCLLVASFILCVSGVYAQVLSSKADGTNIPNTANGFYYSLPQTVLKIDLVFEKVESIKGPLSEYATEYLGLIDFISSNKSEYNLLSADVSNFYEADPNQIFFVQFVAERDKDAKSNEFTLTDIGGLSSYNSNDTQSKSVIIDETNISYIYSDEDKSFPYYSQYNKRKKTDTIIRTINIDTVVIDRFLFKTSWVDMTSADKAKEASLQIEKLRESRYNLISGYQEVNYGTSIIYMDNQLREMETEYLELFAGKTIKTLDSRTIYYIPEKNTSSEEIFDFEDDKSVDIKIKTKGTENLPDSPLQGGNGIFYRIPVTATIEINSDNAIFFSGRFNVNQLGNVITAPLNNVQLHFDSETGNILSIIRE